MTSTAQKHYLLLGGCGFIGWNLVHLISTTQPEAKITVADMKPPGRCFIPPHIEAIYNDATKLTFIHADLAQEAHVNKVFPPDQPTTYTHIIYLMGETRNNMSQENIISRTTNPCLPVVRRIVDLIKLSKTITDGTAIIPFLVYISTSQVYDCSSSTASTESGKIKPFTYIATAHLSNENTIKEHYQYGLRACILRPSLIYGPGDVTSLSPRLCCAAIYQQNNETLKVLWNKDLSINTVHIEDMVRSIIHVCIHSHIMHNSILNISDMGNTTQGILNTYIENIFNIKTSFVGSIMSNIARLKIEQVADDANELHLPDWLSLLSQYNIAHSPYSTYISYELLLNNPIHINGKAIIDAVPGHKFEYIHPTLTASEVYNSLQDPIERKLYPPITLKQPNE